MKQPDGGQFSNRFPSPIAIDYPTHVCPETYEAVFIP